MSELEGFNPSWRSPPGDTIKDILAERGLTLDDLALQLAKPTAYVEVLLTGEAQITPEIATDLAKVLGASPQFWLNRDANFRKPQKETP